MIIIVVTERDIQILAFINRWRCVRAIDIMHRFEITQPVAYRRLASLVKDELLTIQKTFVGMGSVWMPTAQGVDLYQSKLGTINGVNLSAPKKVNLATLDHDLKTLEIAIVYELDGQPVLSDREIRSKTTKRTETGRMIKELEHIPDFVILDENDKWICHEIELSHKSYSALQKVIKAYARMPKVKKIVYHVESKALASHILELAKRNKIDDILEIKNTKEGK